jgi:hypothetical protein
MIRRMSPPIPIYMWCSLFYWGSPLKRLPARRGSACSALPRLGKSRR